MDQQSSILRKALAQHALLRKTLEEDKRVGIVWSRGGVVVVVVVVVVVSSRYDVQALVRILV